MSSTWREPGEIVRLTVGQTVFPLRISATFIMSSSEELVQEPMHTWSTLGPISLTDFTASGEWGQAAAGGKRRKVDVDDLGIFGVIVGKTGVKSCSRPCAFRNSFRDLVGRED